MTNSAPYIDGVKQWQPWSEYHKPDPYALFMRNLTARTGCYSVDVDTREIRIVGGKPKTVAYIERECCPDERIFSPLKYLNSFWANRDMTLKLGSLADDARVLNIPAYFVAHTANMRQFIVVTLPWDGQTYREMTSGQYKQFIESLGKTA